jgi:hypothetical protein
MNTYFYIDAFNLYFGSCRGTPYNWLDVAALMKVVFPRNSIGAIKYLLPTELGSHDSPN